MTMAKHHSAGDATRDAFFARMEAQCDLIEQYRLTVMQKEGRVLSQDEAGLEWIARYAEGYNWSGDDS